MVPLLCAWESAGIKGHQGTDVPRSPSGKAFCLVVGRRRRLHFGNADRDVAQRGASARTILNSRIDMALGAAGAEVAANRRALAWQLLIGNGGRTTTVS